MPETLLKQLKALKKKSRQVYKKNKDIIFDIVAFGSTFKEKAKPSDIDICVIFLSSVKKNSIDKILGEFSECHASYLILSEIYSEPLWMTLFHEGYSLLKNKFLYKIFNLNSFIIFKYNLKKMNAVQKSSFSHALFGRKRDGILYKLNGKILGRGCVMVPIEKSEKVREVLERWKVDYSISRAFIT